MPTKLAEVFRAEAVQATDAELERLRGLPFAAASALPEIDIRDIVLAGREAQLTIYRQSDVPQAGQVMVTVQIARHALGGMNTFLTEKGLVFGPSAQTRDATEQELSASK